MSDPRSNRPERPERIDLDEQETREWLESLDAVVSADGPDRAHYLIERLIEHGQRSVGHVPYPATTAYRNTIPAHLEARSAGDAATEWRIRSLIRWNAVAMVVRANRDEAGLGGHLASFASAATLYDVGFNHFFRAPTPEHGGDLVYVQGHSAPGIYARAFLEGRLTEEQLDRFRREVDGRGLSSYPHPWLMPDFWQFPTVSMGLGPLTAIYQARVLRYLDDRGMAKTRGRKVWCFCGDGEMDEPESLGAISLAGRERLEDLIFVVNCNLQRLDGPVRGNGKIIQELEGTFRGAGWNVIKVIWGSYWDPLFARDDAGLLQKRMDEALDGDYQNYKAHGGAYVREHFFGKYPALADMVSKLSDDDIWRLNRGGHDPHKVYAAYHDAVHHEGQPTVILAKTVKGYGLGPVGEGKNVTHQLKKLDAAAIRSFRDRFQVPIPDDQLEDVPFYRPPEDSPEIRYLKERRAALGGSLPQRRRQAETKLEVPPREDFNALDEDSGEREYSTTTAFVRVLGTLTRDEKIGKHVVPIVADEARTFGMEGMFRQLGIYSAIGQLYEPVDRGQLMFYREDREGQILQEGITEAGAFSSWLAAATSYSTNGVPMIPFFILYSMFGFQRIGDLAWLAGDMRARGFVLGGTAGRTTLNGEGLQHQDGQSLLFASVYPNCRTYDPAYAYEVADIVHRGLEEMFVEQRDVHYYITVENENYHQPAKPEGSREGILKGLHRVRDGGEPRASQPRIQLLGSGAILNEVMAAAEMLESDFEVAADVFSATSFIELAREGREMARWNRLHPGEEPRICHATKCLSERPAPALAATDYVAAVPELIRRFVPVRYASLGTDGFGRSDTRAALRAFFEVDRRHVAYTAVTELVAEGTLPPEAAARAMERYEIDPDKADPETV